MTTTRDTGPQTTTPLSAGDAAPPLAFRFATVLGQPPVGALTGGEVVMLRAWAEDYARAERMAERQRWEAAIGAVMPPDFRQWHNSPAERPETAAWCIVNAREQRDQAEQNTQHAVSKDALRAAGELVAELRAEVARLSAGPWIGRCQACGHEHEAPPPAAHAAVLDCRTCRHHTTATGGCVSVLRCIDGSAYQRAGVRRCWESGAEHGISAAAQVWRLK